jgi:hypothetical protein
VKLLATVILAAGCAHSSPQPPAQAQPPVQAQPPPALAFYVGHWKCTGTSYDAKGAVEAQFPALEVAVTPEYTSWLKVVVYDHGKQVTSELKGIDAKGVYHHVFTDDEGGYGSVSSPGWTGNQLVFDEDHPGASGKTRMTFTKLDDAHYTHKAEVDSGAGWKLGFEKTCHKV